MNYYEIGLLKNFYFEDSYVLKISETKHSLYFDIEAVLTTTHPEYTPPKEGELYSYKNISLCFMGAKSIEWIERIYNSFSDSTGAIDFGNIDQFIIDDAVYLLSGDWGRVRISGGTVQIFNFEDKPSQEK